MVQSVVKQVVGVKHDYPGALVVVEGTDGSGKSTQLQLLGNWLEIEGFAIRPTEWNSSNLVSGSIKKGKKKGTLNPITFSLLHATDFADRLEGIIIPALKAGLIVLADRYMYTAFARDVARGVPKEWVCRMYNFAVIPDAAFYFKVPVDISLNRITVTRPPKYYEAGMDLNLSDDPSESYRMFQSRVIEEYDQISPDFGLHIIDGTRPIYEQQAEFRKHISSLLNDKFNYVPQYRDIGAEELHGDGSELP